VATVTERFEGDQWGIVSGVGYTALVVAAWRALHAADRDPLVRDEYAERFISASADPYLTALLANPPTSVDASAFPRLYGVQTRFFDEFFRWAAADGVRQAVIVAAGLDSRAYRLEWPAGTTVFEIDRPQVLEFKARVLAGEPVGDRREVAADLRADWSIPLTAAGFDAERPAAWSVEGLLPYLTPAAQDDLFSSIDDLSAHGSRLAVGALGSHCDPKQLAALESAHPGVNLPGQPDFSSLTYESEGRGDVAQWLSEHGWVVDDVTTSPRLQARYGRTPPPVDISVDRVLRSRYITATRG
jgi:methyltransferase (TIGR00027 family)